MCLYDLWAINSKSCSFLIWSSSVSLVSIPKFCLVDLISMSYSSLLAWSSLDYKYELEQLFATYLEGFKFLLSCHQSLVNIVILESKLPQRLRYFFLLFVSDFLHKIACLFWIKPFLFYFENVFLATALDEYFLSSDLPKKEWHCLAPKG